MLPKFTFTLLLLLAVSITQAQLPFECGSEMTEENLETILRIHEAEPLNLKKATLYIPTTVHILRNDDGSGGLDIATFNEAFSELNTHYGQMDVQFELCGAINYIDNTDFNDYDKTEENDLAYPTEVSQTLNLYFVETLINNGTSICGYANFPSYDYADNNLQTSRVVILNVCANGTILAHEIGHFFGLRHTHDYLWFGEELVDGSNCDNAGDLFCDTPADPNLYGITQNCVYGGTDVDANGDLYTPSLDNIMSYSPWECTSIFTPEQQNYVLQSLNSARSYLACMNEYAVPYNCSDYDEPNNSFQESAVFDIDSSYKQIEYQDLCIVEDDQDWYSFNWGADTYYFVIEGVDQAVGAYTLDFELDGSLLSLETKPRYTLNHDTRITVFEGDQLAEIAMDDNSGIDNYSKLTIDLSATPIADQILEVIGITPNVVKDHVNVSVVNFTSLSPLKVINISGKIIETKSLNSNNETIDLSHLSPGIYFAVIDSKNGRFVQKMIKK